MEDIKMTVDEIREAMRLQLFGGYAENTELDLDYITDEDYTRMEALHDRIGRCMAMDDKYKLQMQNDMDMTILAACSNAYEVGFNLGVSILKCLLNAEMPTIHVLHRPAERLERAMPAEEKTSVDNKLTACMAATLPYMTEEQKIKLQGKLEYWAESNKQKFDRLF